MSTRDSSLRTVDLQHVSLPPLWCPIPPGLHPQVDRIEADAIAWIDQAGLHDNDTERAWIIATRSAEFYARLAPDADPDRLLVAVLWVYWGFAFDDIFCDSVDAASDPTAFPVVAGTVLRALEAPEIRRAIAPPRLLRFCEALQDIATRMRRIATPTQIVRMITAHRMWLLAVAWQIVNRSRGTTPSLDDYLTIRLNDSGGAPTFTWLEITNEQQVPAAERDHSAVRALTEMAILVAALHNDAHSLARERALRQTEHNIYTVLLADGHDLPGAIQHATALRDDILARFLRLRGRLAPHASPPLRTYLDSLGHAIRGNAEWGLSVPRYVHHGTAHEPDARGHIVWATAPTALPDIAARPATTTWWDHVDSEVQ